MNNVVHRQYELSIIYYCFGHDGTVCKGVLRGKKIVVIVNVSKTVTPLGKVPFATQGTIHPIPSSRTNGSLKLLSMISLSLNDNLLLCECPQKLTEHQ